MTAEKGAEPPLLELDDVFQTLPPADADVEIALVVQLNTPGQTQFAVGLNRQLITTAIDALHEVGARTVVYDVGANRDPDYAAIARADGVLVLGGGDVDATLYGFAEPVPNEYGKDRRADDREIKIIQRGIADDAIMLHLCRGSQLLNVACGGSLIPDLAGCHPHRGKPGESLFLDEAIELMPDSIIGRLYDTSNFTVRNGHHQAVDRLGEGLKVTARASDGVTEGTERIDNTWIIGVQWHPEEINANTGHRRLLFEEFVAQARKHRDRHTERVA